MAPLLMLSHTNGVTWDIRLLNMSRSIRFCGLKFSGIGLRPKRSPLFIWPIPSAMYILSGQKQKQELHPTFPKPPNIKNQTKTKQKQPTKMQNTQQSLFFSHLFLNYCSSSTYPVFKNQMNPRNISY